MCRDKVFLLMNHRIFAESLNFAGVTCNSVLHNSIIRKFIPPEEYAVGCCNSIITVFIMNISVCFLEMTTQDPHGHPVANAGFPFFFMTEEGLPPTFCSIIIFKTHPASLL
ncbi:hypothetical protein DAPPUDRAFT_312624 [Daphnia pulex]|uniref:Uncharacterized protein n=1 Tax=Daphnia pulex TaxID=6669 RepID=E9FZQ7_DAPPU|nr:hypothetical protein DAPPUDRAFT_312624 [Daphnia pulex]|eukprot:EFX87226.1 hypothetical protein DAPPUDRAFT_312624 [Daphnia pulex]